MYMKITRLARAGKCGALGASGLTAAPSASFVAIPDRAVKPNPAERDCNSSRRFNIVRSAPISEFSAGKQSLIQTAPRGLVFSRFQIFGRAFQLFSRRCAAQRLAIHLDDARL